jgi:hypothetical protein
MKIIRSTDRHVGEEKNVLHAGSEADKRKRHESSSANEGSALARVSIWVLKKESVTFI